MVEGIEEGRAWYICILTSTPVQLERGVAVIPKASMVFV